MKIIKFLLIFGCIIFIFFLFFGYDKNYGFYFKEDLHIEEKVSSISYMEDNYEISIKDHGIGISGNNYSIIFSGSILNKSPHTLESIIVIPRLNVELEGKNVEVDLSNFAVMSPGQKLSPQENLKFTKVLDFKNFNLDYLNYKATKATFSITFEGSNSLDYKISDHANVYWWGTDSDITLEWNMISK
ncbi:hypothetical protein HYN48_13235 [Flavobacterium magnum]|uniref:Uncharacterized protein n=1 Tax=Flavobacterium magnum TaxID=2162713 RepID=A0A2S0RGS8_9FLAO|nr:hypothetical protein [Flavobacterium magnum]AWA30963.1 hypothetical protein HYN48_13235 [Flavobacterium magnum]